MSSPADAAETLNTIPPNCLVLICQFLGPGSIFVLDRVAKPLYEFTRAPSNLSQLAHIFNLPASDSVWSEQFRRQVSIRTAHPNCPELTLDLDASPTPNCIRLGSLSLYTPFESFDTFNFHDGYGVLRRKKLTVFNNQLELIRSVDWSDPILNSLAQGRGSPYLCSVADGAVKFIEPMTGDVIYSFKCQDVKMYFGNYLLTVSKSSNTIGLIEFDFQGKQHSTLWTKSFELHKDSEFRMRGDYILHFYECDRLVFELSMFTARTGDLLWQKTIKGVKINVSLSESVVTVWNMLGNSLQIRHFECDSGADYEKSTEQTSHVFRPAGCVARPALIGDGFMVTSVPFIHFDHKLVVVDFCNASITKEVVHDLRQHRLAIAFREMPFAPVKVKVLNLQELCDDNRQAAADTRA